jgi:hypothetical protein
MMPACLPARQIDEIHIHLRASLWPMVDEGRESNCRRAGPQKSNKTHHSEWNKRGERANALRRSDCAHGRINTEGIILFASRAEGRGLISARLSERKVEN